MTDLEIIKQEVDFLDKYMADHELDERFEAILTHATRMAAEIERLLNIIVENQKEMSRLRNEAVKLMIERDSLKAALAEKPDIVKCGECSNLVINDNAKYCGICLDAKRKRNDFCSYGTRKEAKDED